MCACGISVFAVPCGLNKYTISSGLRNALAAFQHIMHMVMSHLGFTVLHSYTLLICLQDPVAEVWE